VSCYPSDGDGDDADTSADNVTSCSHGDAVVAEADEPCSDQPVVESHQPASVSPAVAAAPLLATQQVHNQLCCSNISACSFFLELLVCVFLSCSIFPLVL